MKKELRSFYVKKRRECFSEEKSITVSKKLIALDEYKEAKNIFCYASYNSEVDTYWLMEKILADGKNLYLPRCITATKEMEVCRVSNLSELQSGAYGIKEPMGDGVSVSLDLVIAPMVAFDREKNRLGYGGGYYDRFLAKTDAVRLGIAFSEQESDKLVKEPTDIPMDIIITEKEVIV